MEWDSVSLGETDTQALWLMVKWWARRRGNVPLPAGWNVEEVLRGMWG